MTRRSYNNDRYTAEKDDNRTAKKSASKAKPAMQASGTVYTKNLDSKARRKKAQEQRDRQTIHEQKTRSRNAARLDVMDRNDLSSDDKYNAQIKKWRKRWWICIAVGVAFIALSWFSRNISGIAFIATIVVAYGMVGVALWIEFAKVQRLRKKMQQGEVVKKTKKQIKHEIEEEERKRAQDEAKRANRKSFFNKKDKDKSVVDFPMDE